MTQCKDCVSFINLKCLLGQGQRYGDEPSCSAFESPKKEPGINTKYKIPYDG